MGHTGKTVRVQDKPGAPKPDKKAQNPQAFGGRGRISDRPAAKAPTGPSPAPAGPNQSFAQPSDLKQSVPNFTFIPQADLDRLRANKLPPPNVLTEAFAENARQGFPSANQSFRIPPGTTGFGNVVSFGITDPVAKAQIGGDPIGAIMAGAYGFGGLGKFFRSKPDIYGGVTKVTAKGILSNIVFTLNPKSTGLIQGMFGLSITTAKLGIAATIFYLSAKVFNAFIEEPETADDYGIAMFVARESGNITLMDEVSEAYHLFFDEYDARQNETFIPFKTSFEGMDINLKGAKFGLSVFDQYVADLKEGIINPEKTLTELAEESHAREREADKTADIERIERLKVYNDEERLANARADKVQARLWARQAEEQRKLDALAREESARFWLEYRKVVMGMRMDLSPSKLNFGFI